MKSYLNHAVLVTLIVVTLVRSNQAGQYPRLLVDPRSPLQITPLSSCKVQLDDGRLIDLSSLDSPSKPRTATDSGNTYKYNPCSPISCLKGAAASAALCQVAGDGTAYNCGDQSTATFNYDGTSLTIKYTSASRSTIMQCQCGSSESFKFVDERPKQTYLIQLMSECCCPDKCNGKKPGGGKLSFGSVLCIIFFSLLGAYLIGGILFMKFAKNRTGIEMLPNHEMWLAMPGNIRSGFSFVMGKVRGGGSGNYQQL